MLGRDIISEKNNMASCEKCDERNEHLNVSALAYWRTTLKSARFVVAPMVDQSELAWRLLCRRYGAELCYTPMLHANVFVKDSTYRKEILISCEQDRPLIVQFCANDPDIFTKACLLAAPYCDGVDLNLGCPQSIAKRGKYGAFLQDEWELVFNLVNRVHRTCPVPISCKIRVFREIDKTVQYAQMLESAGCQLLTVHGRTREQKGSNTGLANWQHIKAVKNAVKIPVFANGNIQFFSDIENCLTATGADGIMIAEGNLHNPCLFQNKHLLTWDVALEYLDLIDNYSCSISIIRAHLFKLFHHSALRFSDIQNGLAKAKNVVQFRNICHSIKERFMDEHIVYERDKSSFKEDGLIFPHWICQPYFRPLDPSQPSSESQSLIEERAKMRKRRLENLNEMAEQTGMSKRHLRRMERRPKRIEAGQKQTYVKCSCGNPLSARCVNENCKRCCYRKSKDQLINCPCHNNWYGDKSEKLKFRSEKLPRNLEPSL